MGWSAIIEHNGETVSSTKARKYVSSKAIFHMRSSSGGITEDLETALVYKAEKGSPTC